MNLQDKMFYGDYLKLKRLVSMTNHELRCELAIAKSINENSEYSKLIQEIIDLRTK